MNKIKFLFVVVFALSFKPIFGQEKLLNIFKEAVFYDGYADTSVFQEPAPQAVLRFKTSVFAKQITPKQLKQIKGNITLKVLGKVACDNYDRLGNVFLTLVPKSMNVYTFKDTSVHRMEIARFITPFMKLGQNPDTVGYYYDISYLNSVFKNKELASRYNFWIEFSFFGVPYAAQKQVKGCEGRKDVWRGSLDLILNKSKIEFPKKTALKIIACDFQFNNYKPGASNEKGKPVKTFEFTTEKALKNVKLYLITSNHGANEGGEEYARRNHFIYIDDQLVLSYIPGFSTCEPYRKYNTQNNGIYTRKEQTNEEWQAFSNWCPGAYIPTRIISLEKLASGTHHFKISVPDAKFKDEEGYIPVSAYLLGEE